MNAESLSQLEKEYYGKHITLSEIGLAGQLALKKASVLVVGAGGLSCPALQYLAAAGVGRIGIVDDDIIESSNLHRQILFSHEDIGRPKAEIASERLSRANPFIEVDFFIERLESTNAERLLDSYSIVLDGSDNFATKYLVNDACVLFDKILVHGSIHGFRGQVSVFNFNDGPTYRCLFPDPPTENALPSCSEMGVLGVLPGIVGNLQACEVIKIITQCGEPLCGKLLLYDALIQSFEILTLRKSRKFSEITELSDLNMRCSIGDMEKKPAQVPEISPVELQKIRDEEKDLVLIDVRENWERQASAILPSQHIPLNDLLMIEEHPQIEKLLPESKIVIYCKAGVRSLIACNSLYERGFKNVYNLTGGTDHWFLEFNGDE